MKYLDGREIRDFIKERQAHQVRGLIQHFKVQPRLTIIQTIDNPVTNIYTRLKQQYGVDIGIVADLIRINQSEVASLIDRLNNDNNIIGIVLQLPLADPSATDKLVELINPDKDIDGLGSNAKWDSATAMAINWLLASYNIELAKRKIAVVGQGRLVGKPLTKMWQTSRYDVTPLDDTCNNLQKTLIDMEVIVTAIGVPGLITADMLRHNAIIVDAGVADDKGKTVGDLADDVYDRNDLIITPKKGGVGPLTIAALMDNVIHASYMYSNIK